MSGDRAWRRRERSAWEDEEERLAALRARIRAGLRLSWSDYVCLSGRDLDLAAAYLEQRLAAGDLGPDHLLLAGHLGDRGAQTCVGGRFGRPTTDLTGWIEQREYWGGASPAGFPVLWFVLYLEVWGWPVLGLALTAILRALRPDSRGRSEREVKSLLGRVEAWALDPRPERTLGARLPLGWPTVDCPWELLEAFEYFAGADFLDPDVETTRLLRRVAALLLEGAATAGALRLGEVRLWVGDALLGNVLEGRVGVQSSFACEDAEEVP